MTQRESCNWRLLNALRETQLEQGRTLQEISLAIRGLVATTSQLVQDQVELTTRVAGIDAVGGIVQTLQQHGEILARLDPGPSGDGQ